MIACRLLIFSFFAISMHNFQQTKLGKDFTNPTIDFYCNFYSGNGIRIFYRAFVWNFRKLLLILKYSKQ